MVSISLLNHGMRTVKCYGSRRHCRGDVYAIVYNLHRTVIVNLSDRQTYINLNVVTPLMVNGDVSEQRQFKAIAFPIFLVESCSLFRSPISFPECVICLHGEERLLHPMIRDCLR